MEEPKETSNVKNVADAIERGKRLREKRHAEALDVTDNDLTSLDEAKKILSKRLEGIPVRLPSCGIVVRAKIPSLTSLIRSGEIPKDLIAVALNWQRGGSLDPDSAKKFVDLVDAVFCLSVVQPKFAIDPEKDSDVLDVATIDDNDKIFIWELIQGGASQLKNFRKK